MPSVSRVRRASKPSLPVRSVAQSIAIVKNPYTALNHEESIFPPIESILEKFPTTVTPPAIKFADGIYKTLDQLTIKAVSNATPVIFDTQLPQLNSKDFCYPSTKIVLEAFLEHNGFSVIPTDGFPHVKGYSWSTGQIATPQVALCIYVSAKHISIGVPFKGSTRFYLGRDKNTFVTYHNFGKPRSATRPKVTFGDHSKDKSYAAVTKTKKASPKTTSILKTKPEPQRVLRRRVKLHTPTSSIERLLKTNSILLPVDKLSTTPFNSALKPFAYAGPEFAKLYWDCTEEQRSTFTPYYIEPTPENICHPDLHYHILLSDVCPKCYNAALCGRIHFHKEKFASDFDDYEDDDTFMGYKVYDINFNGTPTPLYYITCGIRPGYDFTPRASLQLRGIGDYKQYFVVNDDDSCVNVDSIACVCSSGKLHPHHTAALRIESSSDFGHRCQSVKSLTPPSKVCDDGYEPDLAVFEEDDYVDEIVDSPPPPPPQSIIPTSILDKSPVPSIPSLEPKKETVPTVDINKVSFMSIPVDHYSYIESAESKGLADVCAIKYKGTPASHYLGVGANSVVIQHGNRAVKIARAADYVVSETDIFGHVNSCHTSMSRSGPWEFQDYPIYDGGSIAHAHVSNNLDAYNSFMTQLCTLVARCHSYGFVHRDLKFSNLLLNADCRTIAVADFGNACALTEQPTEKLGTPGYDIPVNPTHIGTADLHAIIVMAIIFKARVTGFVGDLFTAVGDGDDTTYVLSHDLLAWYSTTVLMVNMYNKLATGTELYVPPNFYFADIYKPVKADVILARPGDVLKAAIADVKNAVCVHASTFLLRCASRSTCYKADTQFSFSFTNGHGAHFTGPYTLYTRAFLKDDVTTVTVSFDTAAEMVDYLTTEYAGKYACYKTKNECAWGDICYLSLAIYDQKPKKAKDCFQIPCVLNFGPASISDYSCTESFMKFVTEISEKPKARLPPTIEGCAFTMEKTLYRVYDCDESSVSCLQRGPHAHIQKHAICRANVHHTDDDISSLVTCLATVLMLPDGNPMFPTPGDLGLYAETFAQRMMLLKKPSANIAAFLAKFPKFNSFYGLEFGDCMYSFISLLFDIRVTVLDYISDIHVNPRPREVVLLYTPLDFPHYDVLMHNVEGRFWVPEEASIHCDRHTSTVYKTFTEVMTQIFGPTWQEACGTFLSHARSHPEQYFNASSFNERCLPTSYHEADFITIAYGVSVIIIDNYTYQIIYHSGPVTEDSIVIFYDMYVELYSTSVTHLGLIPRFNYVGGAYTPPDAPKSATSVTNDAEIQLSEPLISPILEESDYDDLSCSPIAVPKPAPSRFTVTVVPDMIDDDVFPPPPTQEEIELINKDFTPLPEEVPLLTIPPVELQVTPELVPILDLQPEEVSILITPIPELIPIPELVPIIDLLPEEVSILTTPIPESIPIPELVPIIDLSVEEVTILVGPHSNIPISEPKEVPITPIPHTDVVRPKTKVTNERNTDEIPCNNSRPIEQCCADCRPRREGEFLFSGPKRFLPKHRQPTVYQNDWHHLLNDTNSFCEHIPFTYYTSHFLNTLKKSYTKFVLVNNTLHTNLFADALQSCIGDASVDLITFEQFVTLDKDPSHCYCYFHTDETFEFITAADFMFCCLPMRAYSTIKQSLGFCLAYGKVNPLSIFMYNGVNLFAPLAISDYIKFIQHKLQKVLNYTAQEYDRYHDFIQYLFPTFKRSSTNGAFVSDFYDYIYLKSIYSCFNHKIMAQFCTSVEAFFIEGQRNTHVLQRISRVLESSAFDTLHYFCIFIVYLFNTYGFKESTERSWINYWLPQKHTMGFFNIFDYRAPSLSVLVQHRLESINVLKESFKTAVLPTIVYSHKILSVKAPWIDTLAERAAALIPPAEIPAPQEQPITVPPSIPKETVNYPSLFPSTDDTLKNHLAMVAERFDLDAHTVDFETIKTVFCMTGWFEKPSTTNKHIRRLYTLVHPDKETHIKYGLDKPTAHKLFKFIGLCSRTYEESHQSKRAWIHFATYSDDSPVPHWCHPFILMLTYILSFITFSTTYLMVGLPFTLTTCYALLGGYLPPLSVYWPAQLLITLVLVPYLVYLDYLRRREGDQLIHVVQSYCSYPFFLGIIFHCFLIYYAPIYGVTYLLTFCCAFCVYKYLYSNYTSFFTRTSNMAWDSYDSYFLYWFGCYICATAFESYKVAHLYNFYTMFLEPLRSAIFTIVVLPALHTSLNVSYSYMTYFLYICFILHYLGMSIFPLAVLFIVNFGVYNGWPHDLLRIVTISLAFFSYNIFIITATVLFSAYDVCTTLFPSAINTTTYITTYWGKFVSFSLKFEWFFTAIYTNIVQCPIWTIFTYYPPYYCVVASIRFAIYLFKKSVGSYSIAVLIFVVLACTVGFVYYLLDFFLLSFYDIWRVYTTPIYSFATNLYYVDDLVNFTASYASRAEYCLLHAESSRFCIYALESTTALEDFAHAFPSQLADVSYTTSLPLWNFIFVADVYLIPVWLAAYFYSLTHIASMSYLSSYIVYVMTQISYIGSIMMFFYRIFIYCKHFFFPCPPRVSCPYCSTFNSSSFYYYVSASFESTTRRVHIPSGTDYCAVHNFDCVHGSTYMNSYSVDNFVNNPPHGEPRPTHEGVVSLDALDEFTAQDSIYVFNVAGSNELVTTNAIYPIEQASMLWKKEHIHNAPLVFTYESQTMLDNFLRVLYVISAYIRADVYIVRKCHVTSTTVTAEIKTEIGSIASDTDIDLNQKIDYVKAIQQGESPKFNEKFTYDQFCKKCDGVKVDTIPPSVTSTWVYGDTPCPEDSPMAGYKCVNTRFSYPVTKIDGKRVFLLSFPDMISTLSPRRLHAVLAKLHVASKKHSIPIHVSTSSALASLPELQSSSSNYSRNLFVHLTILLILLSCCWAIPITFNYVHQGVFVSRTTPLTANALYDHTVYTSVQQASVYTKYPIKVHPYEDRPLDQTPLISQMFTDDVLVYRASNGILQFFSARVSYTKVVSDWFTNTFSTACQYLRDTSISASSFFDVYAGCDVYCANNGTLPHTQYQDCFTSTRFSYPEQVSVVPPIYFNKQQQYCLDGRCYSSYGGYCLSFGRPGVYNKEYMAGGSTYCGTTIAEAFLSIFAYPYNAAPSIANIWLNWAVAIVAVVVFISIILSLVWVNRLFGTFAVYVYYVFTIFIIAFVLQTLGAVLLYLQPFCSVLFLLITAALPFRPFGAVVIDFITNGILFFGYYNNWFVMCYLVFRLVENFGFLRTLYRVTSFKSLYVTSASGQQMLNPALTKLELASRSFLLDKARAEYIYNTWYAGNEDEFSADMRHYARYSRGTVTLSSTEYNLFAVGAMAQSINKIMHGNLSDIFYMPPSLTAFVPSLQASISKIFTSFTASTDPISSVVCHIKYAGASLHGVWIKDQVIAPRHILGVPVSVTGQEEADAYYVRKLATLIHSDVLITSRSGNLTISNAVIKGTNIVFNVTSLSSVPIVMKTAKPGDVFTVADCMKGLVGGTYNVCLASNGTIMGDFDAGSCGSPGYYIEHGNVILCYIHQVKIPRVNGVASEYTGSSPVTGAMYAPIVDAASTKHNVPFRLLNSFNIGSHIVHLLSNARSYASGLPTMTESTFNARAVTYGYERLSASDITNLTSLCSQYAVPLGVVIYAIRHGFGRVINGVDHGSENFVTNRTVTNLIELQSSSTPVKVAKGIFSFMFCYISYFVLAMLLIGSVSYSQFLAFMDISYMQFYLVILFAVVFTKRSFIFVSMYVLPTICMVYCNSLLAAHINWWSFFLSPFYHSTFNTIYLFIQCYYLVILCVIFTLVFIKPLYRSIRISIPLAIVTICTTVTFVHLFYFSMKFVTAKLLFSAYVALTIPAGFIFPEAFLLNITFVYFAHFILPLSSGTFALLYLFFGFICTCRFGFYSILAKFTGGYLFNRTYYVSRNTYHYMYTHDMQPPKDVFTAIYYSWLFREHTGSKNVQVSVLQSSGKVAHTALATTLIQAVPGIDSHITPSQFKVLAQKFNAVLLAKDTALSAALLDFMCCYFSYSKVLPLNFASSLSNAILKAHDQETTVNLTLQLASDLMDVPSAAALALSSDRLNSIPLNSPDRAAALREYNRCKAIYDQEASNKRKQTKMVEQFMREQQRQFDTDDVKTKLHENLHAVAVKLIKNLGNHNIIDFLTKAADGIMPLNALHILTSTELVVTISSYEKFTKFFKGATFEYCGFVWNVTCIKDSDGVVITDITQDHAYPLTFYLTRSESDTVMLQCNYASAGDIKVTHSEAVSANDGIVNSSVYSISAASILRPVAVVSTYSDLSQVTHNSAVYILKDPFTLSIGDNVYFVYMLPNTKPIDKAAVIIFASKSVSNAILQAFVDNTPSFSGYDSDISLISDLVLAVDPIQTYKEHMLRERYTPIKPIALVTSIAGQGRAITDKPDANVNCFSYAGSTICLHCISRQKHKCTLSGKYVQIPRSELDPISYFYNNTACVNCQYFDCTCTLRAIETVMQAKNDNTSGHFVFNFSKN